LGFEPSKDYWSKSEPDLYTIANSEVSGRLVNLEFPNPFGDAGNLAKLVIGVVAGLISLIVRSNFAGRRKFKRLTLSIVLFISVMGLGLTYYFFTTLADPVGFLAAVNGFAVPWVIAPFVCGYYIIRLTFDAEVTGLIYVDNEAK